MKKTTKLLIISSFMAITHYASADTIHETAINPCALLADASCEVDSNGQIVITGDGSEGVASNSKFDDHRAILVDALDTYKICALESANKKDLRVCRKSFKNSLKK